MFKNYIWDSFALKLLDIYILNITFITSVIIGFEVDFKTERDREGTCWMKPLQDNWGNRDPEQLREFLEVPWPSGLLLTVALDFLGFPVLMANVPEI